MGNSCCAKKKRPKKITLLLVGLDNAGKTVAAKTLAGEPPDDVVPTVGFSVVNLTYRHFKVVLFDLGGGSDIRGIWDEYFVYAHGVIFVVDSSDYNRLEEAKTVLQELLSHRKVSGKPILLLANKQDEENALDELDLVEKLQLETIVNSCQCPTLVETCCAEESLKKSTMDTGIKKGYRWLMNYIINNFEGLNKRVEVDVHEYEGIQRKIRMEIIERMRVLSETEQKCQKDLTDVIELYSEYEKQNGTAKTTENDDLVIKQKRDGSETGSKESLPHIYHVKTSKKEEQRPKSALQLVKQQLELEQSEKLPSYRKFISNKTAPLSSYGGKLPHSASEKRAVFSEGRRTLKSAGDSIFVVSDIPNAMPVTSHGDDFHRELFQLNNFDKKAKLPPLKKVKLLGRLNGTVNGCGVEENGISIIEVD